MNPITQPTAISRLPVVRFTDEALRTNNSQHLTCIQNVLLQNNSRMYAKLSNNSFQLKIIFLFRRPNEISSPIVIRKPFLRSKFTHMKYRKRQFYVF